jgi:Ni/Co efflux regulator RcnB
MKRTVMAATVLSLVVGSVAFADPPQDYHHDRDQRQQQRHDEHRDRDRWHQPHDEHHGWRGDGGHEMRGREHFEPGRYLRPRGYYTHHWRHGDRLPPAWREPRYLIPDWNYYRLQPPPPGYYWVRVNDNAVLAAIATGIVVDVAVNVFH